MTKLYMNPEKLAGKIEAMWALAMSATVAKSRIDDQSEQLHDPMKAVSIDVHLTSIQTAIDAVNARASDIAKCKNVIEDLNSNGVTVADSSGGITVEIPTEANVTSSETLSQWAQGATDAHDLKNLDNGGRLPSGRSYDDLVKSIQLNKESATYANGLIDTIGPENLTQIPLDVQKHFTIQDPRNRQEYSYRPGAGGAMAELLGSVLATASQTWGVEKSETVADKIVGSMDEKGEWGKITVLNAMIGGHDANGDHVNDLKFGKDFLVSLGDDLEELPWSTISTYSRLKNGSVPSRDYSSIVTANLGASLGGYSFDPLAGVIDAMTNHGEAAAEFFAPNGVESSKADIERIRKIAERHEFGDNDWTNDLSIISHAMSDLGRIDTTQASEAQIAQAGRAALGTSVLLNTIGESDANLSDLALQHVGQTLKNYAPGVDHSMQGAGSDKGNGSVQTYLSGYFPDGSGGMRNDFGDSFWGEGIAVQPTFSNFALSNLTGQLGMTKDGLDPLKVEMALINDKRMNEATAVYNDTGDNDKLQQAIAAYQHTQGFVAGAIGHEGEQRGEEADKQAKAWIDGIAGLTTFIPGVEGAGHLLNASMSYAQSRGQQGLKQALEEEYASNADKAAVTAMNNEVSAEIAAKRAVTLKLLESGAITPEEVNAWSSREGSTTIFNEDGTLNYANLRSDNEITQDAVGRSFLNIDNNFPTLASEAVEDAYDDGVDTEFGDGKDNATTKAVKFGK